jgi:cytochrome c oxidase subunit 1
MKTSESLANTKNCNHKRIGLYYLLSAFLFGLSGTIFSGLIRLELYSSGNRIIPSENHNFYNISITLHGLLMIFFLVMPGLFGGFGNYFIPVFLGAPEVVYPRINNISILILPLSYISVILSVTGEFSNGTGWTLYPPLSTSLMSLSPIGIDILLYGLLLSGISSCLTSINFIATIINMRCYGFNFSIMPVYAWSIYITGFLLLLTLPILTGALIMLLADLHYNTVFFDPIFGGDPVLYQHLFWFFGHPEVYILIIPAFGIISIIISGITQIIIFGNQSMILAMSCICVLGSVVWGHHMYTVGMESDTRAYFTAVTMMISLPTGTKIFNWLCTYLNNNVELHIRTSAALFTLIFLLMFTIGGSTGVILGNAVVDIALHDTYYVVAHFHFVLSLGAVIAIFSGIMYFQVKISGTNNYLPTSTSLSERYHFIMTFFGILLTFTPMHFLGFNVMPCHVGSVCLASSYSYLLVFPSYRRG